MRVRILAFLSVILTALALVPSAAHFFELPNKIAMTEEQYFVAQSIYRGWAQFGFVLGAALVANTAFAVALRRRRAAALLAGAGALAIALVFVVFFVWVYPANLATAYWTLATDNWQSLRRDWEYAHAANALITFFGLSAVTLAALLAREAR
ncbi:MAG: DUF1772 domain-containing protein [Alphaproteobacteria bacterium]